METQPNLELIIDGQYWKVIYTNDNSKPTSWTANSYTKTLIVNNDRLDLAKELCYRQYKRDFSDWKH